MPSSDLNPFLVVLAKCLGEAESAVQERGRLSASNGSQAIVAADMAICLAIRAAFSSFVEYFSWLVETSPDEAVVHRLAKVMADATELLSASDHEYSKRYLESVRSKAKQLQLFLENRPVKEIYSDLFETTPG